MNFCRPAHFLALSFALALCGCHRTVSPVERAARSQLKEAFHQRAYARAIPLARTVLRFDPQDDDAWARLAQAQMATRDLAGWKTTMDEWTRAIPKSSAKREESRGDFALAENRHADAIAAWRLAGASRRRLRVFAKIARLQQADGRWAEAANAWTRAMKHRQTAHALLQRAICYRHLHSWEAALADVRRASQLSPGDPEVSEQHAFLDRLGKFLPEVHQLDRELLARPNDGQLLADRALLFLRANDAPLALDDANRAAKAFPEAVRPKLFRALAQENLGQPIDPEVSPGLKLETLSPEFLEIIRRLDGQISAESTSAELLTNRAWQLNEIGQPQLALHDAETARKLTATSAGAAAEAAYALAKLKRAPEAYAQIKAATELDANFSTAWQYRGELEMQQGNFLAGSDSLSRALGINQTAEGLRKREECYRKLGLAAKADADAKSLEQLRPPAR